MSIGRPGSRGRAGGIGALVVAAVYGGLALFTDPVAARNTTADPTALVGFQSDEATYYLMGQSLAFDGDVEYRAQDLERLRRDFPTGPQGVFLKRGVDVTSVGITLRPPFVTFSGVPDPDQARLYYGKSFVYPLFAAPFVRVFGTRGFYVLNAALLALAFLCSYLFISARSGVRVGLVLGSAFVFATVVPVYYAWIAPELFNFSMGLLAYFVWLYKVVASGPSSRFGAWLRTSTSDLLAGGLVGLLTFSKVSNALLAVPIVGWLLWRRQWARAMGVAAAWGVVTAMFFAVNVATSGELSYQGGLDRRTCYNHFPFETPTAGLGICEPRARNEALGDVIFDREVFWSNLRANAVYFVAGRNSGLVAYFFPAVFAILSFLWIRRDRAGWQWFVLGGLVAQALLFIVSQPYTYFGSGGSVGNRYFMGAYGLAVFLLPPIRSVFLSLVPWIVGAVFMAPLVLSPFDTSMRPADHSKGGPLRVLPVELTNVNDLPMTTARTEMVHTYGITPSNPGFQIYYLDDNAYLPEADKLSFWIRGESRAEVLIKATRPFERLQLTLRSGPVRTTSTVRVGGKSIDVTLEPDRVAIVQMMLGPGFPYKKDRPTDPETGRPEPAYVWVMSVSSSAGFVPVGSNDTRYLGVRVLPVIIVQPIQPK